MKTLFQNYCSSLSTEAMYFHRCFVEAGEEAVMWSDSNQSVFDTFDFVKPDIFVTHFRFLTHDVFKYLSAKKNIVMALNVTGASKEDIETIEGLAKQSNIDNPTMFTNLYNSNNNLKGLPTKIHGVYPAADVFIPVMPTPDYKLENCFFSLDDNQQLSELKEKEDEYHVVSFSPNPERSYSDMTLDVTSAASFYHKYKKCHLVGDINFVSSQVLLDCLLKSDLVKIKVPDEQQDLLEGVFMELFEEPSQDGDVGSIIKSQVKKRHNCFRRSSRLARILKNKELSGKLERMSESL